MTPGDGAAESGPKCMACGRLLRDDESKRLRLGPVCRRRLTDLLAPRPRIVGTHTAGPHPQAIPARVTAQLAFDIWDDQDDDEQPASRRITDVPTGALL